MVALLFTSQNRKFELTQEMLLNFVGAFPASEKYSRLIKTILLLGLPDVTAEIIKRRLLSSMELKECFEHAPESARSAILEVPEFRRLANSDQAFLDALRIPSRFRSKDFLERILLDGFPPEEVVRDFGYRDSLMNPHCSGVGILGKRHGEFMANQTIRALVLAKQEPFTNYALQLVQGSREKVVLKINEREFLCDLQILIYFASYCIDDCEENAQLVNSLMNLEIPLLTQTLIWTDLVNPERLDTLWRSGSIDICRELCRNYTFLSRLSDEQAGEIIALEDLPMLDSLAVSMRYFYDGSIDLEERRLSEVMLDKLMLFLATRRDRDITRLLHHHSDAIPERYQAIYQKRYSELFPQPDSED